MCGRTACALEKKTIVTHLQALVSANKSFQWKNAECLGGYRPAYNKAPGSFNPVIISSLYASNEGESSDFVVQEMRWGLIPSFVPNQPVEQASKSSQSFATANARADTLTDRPAYRSSIQRGWRCAIISQGFYEWQRIGSQKKPFFFSMSGEKDNLPLMFMAGLFSMNREHTLYTYTVITTDAVNVVSSIHDRMPIIFDCLDEALAWVDGGSITTAETCSRLSKFAKKLNKLEITSYPVNPAVNYTKYDCPECIEPYIEGNRPSLFKLRTLDNFFTRNVVKKKNTDPKTEEPDVIASLKRSLVTEPTKTHLKKPLKLEEPQ